MSTTIQDCAEIYKTLLRKKYILHLENDLTLELVFAQENFKHLIGFHKLEDMPQIFSNSSKKIYRQALKNKNNLNNTVRKSSYYKDISNRVLYFHLIPSILNSKIIVDFDPNKMPIDYKSKLQNTDYILYKRIEASKIAHLTIISDKEYYKPETFFIENSSIYLSDQTLYDIIDIEVIDF